MNFTRELRVKPGKKIQLLKWDSSMKAGFEKDSAQEILDQNIERLAKLQYLLYADGRQSLLIILQGMDTSGKDGVIRHVMKSISPLNCQVFSFKVPSSREKAQDYLWRIHYRTPARGKIAVFNRSHYESVLVERVKKIVDKKVWKKRYHQINEFEQMLTENGTAILKFFLHISKEEQLERLEERLENPDKNWKFNPADIEERGRWEKYTEAYEDALAKCSTKWAPWYIIPSNRKWFRNLAISEILTSAMEGMKLKFPKPSFDPKKIKIS